MLCLVFVGITGCGKENAVEKNSASIYTKENAECLGVLKAKDHFKESFSQSQEKFLSTVQPRFIENMKLVLACVQQSGGSANSLDDISACAKSKLSPADSEFLLTTLITWRSILVGKQQEDLAVEMAHANYCAPLGITQN